MNRVAVVIPNWNGADLLSQCIDSLLAQSNQKFTIIVVENGSTDSSMAVLNTYKKKVVVLEQKENLGFAGGVNVGINYSINHGFEYVALLNNDANVDKNWLKNLVSVIDSDEKLGIVTSKILIGNSGILDSTGDWYTTTGMPFPRGRNEVDKNQYDNSTTVFGASGGASLYRIDMLNDVGLFDEDFFAYYEDVDISFRAQLRGWKVRYVPNARVYHQLSATSSKMGYFAIRQSAKNFWFIYVKNMPYPLSIRFLPSAIYRYARMFAARIIKGGFWAFTSGFIQSIALMPKKIRQRKVIQKNKTVTNHYLLSIIHKGKPPVVDAPK